MPRAIDDAGIAQALDAVYESAVNSNHWPIALERLATLFNSHFADLFARTDDRTHFQGLVFGLDRNDYAEKFLGTWVKRNVWGTARPVEVAGEVLSTREMVPKPDLLRSEIYNEYLHPRGLHEGLRLAIWSGGGWIQDISLLRPWSAGPFAAEEIALGRMLLPHIQRAAATARRVQQATLSAQVGFEALDLLHHAALLLDASCRVLQVNRAAERMLEAADGLRMSGPELVAAREADSRNLRAAVAGAAGLGGRPPQSGAVALSRPSGRPPLSATVIPVRESGGWLSLRLPAALLLISDMHANATLSAALITRQFGLTETECDLALDLLAGRSVAAIAGQRGRSVHTVRTHLAHLMGKTQTNRQSDLLRLLMTIARGGEAPLAGENVVDL